MICFICAFCSGRIFVIMASGIPIDCMCAKISFSVIFVHFFCGTSSGKTKYKKTGKNRMNKGVRSNHHTSVRVSMSFEAFFSKGLSDIALVSGAGTHRILVLNGVDIRRLGN